jgi:large-conductance mechanosensitive channel
MNDKFKHFVAGAIITLIVGAVLHNAIYGLIASMIAGIGKELWDYMGNGVSDFDDVLATLQGAIIGCLFLCVWWWRLWT